MEGGVVNSINIILGRYMLNGMKVKIFIVCFYIFNYFIEEVYDKINCKFISFFCVVSRKNNFGN